MRVTAFVSCLLLVGLSTGQVWAVQRTTDDQKQTARDKAKEEAAERKAEAAVLAQVNKPTPAIRFHPTRHSTPEVSWLYGKKKKGSADPALFLGK